MGGTDILSLATQVKPPTNSPCLFLQGDVLRAWSNLNPQTQLSCLLTLTNTYQQLIMLFPELTPNNLLYSSLMAELPEQVGQAILHNITGITDLYILLKEMTDQFIATTAKQFG